MYGWSIHACGMNERAAQRLRCQTFVAPAALWSAAAPGSGRHRVAMIAGCVTGLIAVLAVLGPLVSSPNAYDTLDWQHSLLGPFGSGSHWLGTTGWVAIWFVRTLNGIRSLVSA